MVPKTLLVAGLLVWAGCAGQPRSDEQDIVVFAAASLTDALDAVADTFEVVYPQYDIVLNVAATSLLARQIEQGAPADVFFSANRAWMEYLETQGRTAGPLLQPLTNQLVVIGRPEAKVLEQLADVTMVERIALADPEHVPAGLYARQGFECAGLWDAVRPRVVPTLDVRAALLAVRSGAADLAVVYASDVLADANVKVLLTWPSFCHPDVDYAAARLQAASNTEGAKRLLAFVMDTTHAALWEQYGFTVR